MNCKKCGRELQEEAKFCPDCGQSREESEKEESAVAERSVQKGGEQMKEAPEAGSAEESGEQLESAEEIRSAEESGEQLKEAPEGEGSPLQTMLQPAAAHSGKKKLSYPLISGIVMGVMALVIIVMGVFLIKGRFVGETSAALDLFDEKGLLAARVGETWGFIDKTGSWVINPQFQDVLSFSEDGLCAVQMPDSGSEDGKWGFIDTKGTYVISPNYADAGGFGKNGLAAVQEWKSDGSGKWGYINKKGEQVIPYQFDEAWIFRGGDQAIVALGEKYGLIDSKGTYLINPQFDELYDWDDLSGKLLSFELDGKKGYADREGNYVIAPEYIDLSSVSGDGYLVYADENKKIGVVGSDGKKLFDQTFDEIDDMSTDDFCKQEGCTEKVYLGDDYCSEHRPKTTSSSSYRPLCKATGCLNRVPYSWRDYCDEHISLEYAN